MIKFKNVYVKYIKDFYLIFNANYKIENHTLFIGDEFLGSTAILRLIGKIEKNYSGEIFMDEKNIKDIKNKELNIAYLSEDPVFFKCKSVLNNLCYPLKIRKILKNEARTHIFNTFFELENKNLLFSSSSIKSKNNQIENFLKIKIKKLSLSEQKIISLLRAYLRKPNYILLENFFENLNAKYIPLACEILNKLLQSSTIIACERNQTDIEIYKNFNKVELTK